MMEMEVFESDVVQSAIEIVTDFDVSKFRNLIQTVSSGAEYFDLTKTLALALEPDSCAVSRDDSD